MEEMEREEKEMKKEGRKDEDEVKRTARQDRAGNSRGRLEVTTVLAKGSIQVHLRSTVFFGLLIWN